MDETEVLQITMNVNAGVFAMVNVPKLGERYFPVIGYALIKSGMNFRLVGIIIFGNASELTLCSKVPGFVGYCTVDDDDNDDGDEGNDGDDDLDDHDIFAVNWYVQKHAFVSSN